MHKRTLPRHVLTGGGWAHPYGRHPFSPVLYADGGDGGDGGSGSGDGGTGGDGGSGGGDGGTGAGSGSGQQGGQTGGAPAAGQGGDGGQDIASLPEWAQKALRDARADAGKARTNAKQQAADAARQDLAQQIGKVLGIVKGDEPADPAQLTKTIGEQTGRIAELESTNRTLSVELAAYKRADKHDANPAALLDSRSFLASVAELDPAAKDFSEALDKAIKKAVEDNAQLRTAPGARRGGGEFNGGPGARGQRPASLSEAVAARLGGTG